MSSRLGLDASVPWHERVIGVALALHLVSRFASMCSRAPEVMWDFQAYYYAALAWRRGLDPYTAAGTVAGGHAPIYDYQYPPLLLALFAGPSRLDYPAAELGYRVFLMASILAFVLVVGLLLLGRLFDPLYLAVVAGAWQYPVEVSATSGNLEVFTVLATWLGIAWLCAGRTRRFAVVTVLAALPKLAPASYALIGVAVGRAHARRATVLALGGVAAWLALNYALAPALTLEWFRRVSTSATDTGLDGWVAPSPLRVARALAPQAAVGVAVVAWLVIAATTIFVLARSRLAPALARACLAAVAIPLLWPHIKDYTYLTYVPPLAWLARDLYDRGGGRRVAGVAASLAMLALTSLRGSAGASPWLDGAPYLFALGLWAALALHVARSPWPAQSS